MLDHPDRVWPLEGASNFRDLGGYPGRDGRPLRWRTLFRSDHLGALTDADRARLASLGLTRSFDLRGVQERAATPYTLDGLTQVPLSIEPTVVQRMQEMAEAGHTLTGDIAIELMTELYRSLVGDRAYRFAELFEHLLQDASPALIHCTAGKDRTGIAVALVLLALGVSRGLVEQDFMLTNTVRRPPAIPRSDTPLDALQVLWRVRESYLHTALQVIDSDHGGIDAYLRERLRLSPAAIAKLQKLYLQQPA
ncbi:MAG TPA: tyrosine-protein phosphatase [Burkholderiaceae bacterium]|nr:tyrosine-protein phosphatase [Burkholderiaceae bacterium]